MFVGRYINVNRKPDGTIYPTFNRPDYNEKLTFAKFCMEAAKELRQVAKLVDSATGLGEGEGISSISSPDWQIVFDRETQVSDLDFEVEFIV